jgi:hypothetical protein
VSTKLFAAYFSSRGRTVKRTSRAGRKRAKLPARRVTMTRARMPAVGGDGEGGEAASVRTGERDERPPTPSRRTTRPARKSCVNAERRFTQRSIRANQAVRAAESVNVAFTIRACSK